MGIYTLSKICPLAVWKGQIALLVDRPTVIFMTVVLPVDRPWIQRADALCRSTGPPAYMVVHVYAHQSTGPVDRLLPRSTVWSTSRSLGQTSYRD